MDTNYLLEHLNEAQREAVTAPPTNLLVIAGAGSGKTRVLVHRIAWLLQAEQVSPYEILAVTFTNKAAAEMRARLEGLLGMSMRNMWVGTFHGLAHRFLRAHWQQAHLPETFQILDAEDQYRLVRRVQASLNLDEDKWLPRQTQGFINQKKDEGLRPHQLQSYGNPITETLTRVYKTYEEVCERSGLVDFAELLLRSYELLRDHIDILAHYQQRFRHILVDEFQDTNTIQYAWLYLLAGKISKLMVVGDDDQSIYSWRGAQVDNIHRFTRDYKDTQVIRLEQNYRSTKTILAAANAVIANNNNRLGKNLWTDKKEKTPDDPISIYAAFNDIDEARFIVSSIQTWVSQGFSRQEIAILYRSNAQSRVIEEELISAAIPYRVYGGLKFFERAEIKDALAYLRLVANRHDDPAFERAVNTPTRGIGNTTMNTVRDFARQHNISLWAASQEIVTHNILPTRATTSIHAFLKLIEQLYQETLSLPLPEQTDHILHGSGLFIHVRKDSSDKAISRVENLEELIQATHQFDGGDIDEIPPLQSFLAHIALETGENQADNFEDSVQLMTLHAAKGLEFKIVFLSGVEEGLFPHRMSASDPARLEEERRLCYVGMTRAMQKLYLTYAETRRLNGTETFQKPSRFIREIPTELLDEVRIKTKIIRPTKISPAYDIITTSDFSLKLGQRVQHPKFGDGTVLNYEGQGEQARIQVKFSKAGTKWLLASYVEPL